MTAADYPDWGVPQANATAISTTGVPLLSAKNLLDTRTAVQNAGTFSLYGPFTITQPSYEIFLNLYETGSGAAAPLQVIMQWNDSLSATPVAYEAWWVWPGVSAGNHIIVGRGPTKADQVYIQLNNTSAAMQYSVFWRLFQSSRIFSRDDWRSTNYVATASGGAIATIDPLSLLVGYRNASVAAAGSDTTELPLYCGRVILSADTTSNTNDMTVRLQDSADPNAQGIGARIVRLKSDANGLVLAELSLPRYQCRVQLSNGNAALQTLNYSVTAAEY